mgnify:CR=1 FL=1
MNGDKVQCCAVCGRAAETLERLPGTGPVCSNCLLAGRFLGSTGAPRLAKAARDLPDFYPRIQQLVGADLDEASRLTERRLHEEARGLLLRRAEDRMAEGQPLLAAYLLQQALSIPGNSALVYAALADAAVAMDCHRESARHYKTAGWLGMQVGDRGQVERALAGLQRVADQDTWIEKARDWLAGAQREQEALCGFCGRPASEVGDLIEGPQARICQNCLDRLSKLQHN